MSEKARQTLKIKWSFTLIIIFLIWGAKPTHAQHLTISTSGQTGTSGTNWSISGNILNIAASGSANIHPNVITNHLTNVGDLTVLLPWQMSVNRITYINNSITYSGNNTRTLTFNSANDIYFASSVSISSTNSSLNLVFRTALNNTTPSLSPDNGLIQMNNVSINTNGGHLWMGGGGITATWNGLTVGNSMARTWADDIPGIALVGSSITTNGGSIYMYGRSHNSDDDNGINYGLNIENSSISTGIGSVTIIGDVNGRYAVGIGLRIAASSSTTSITSTSGSINLTGIGYDQTTNGNSWRIGNLITGLSASIKTIISSSSGNILVEGNANFTATVDDKEGLSIGGSTEVVSQTGNINLVGTNTLESPGQFCNSIRFAPADVANSIRIGFNGTNAYSGNITIEGNSIYQRYNCPGTGSIAVQTTGGLTIQSRDAAFTHLRAGDNGTLTFDDDWNFGTQLSSFTYGKSTNTAALSYASELTVSGPITFHTGNFTINKNITSSTASDITINAINHFYTSNIRQSITTAGGNIIINADADGNGTGLLDLDYLTFNPGSGNTIIRGSSMNWVTTNNTDKPYINGTGNFTFEPYAATFGQFINTVWFDIDQDNNGIGALNLGKATNTQDIIIAHTRTAINHNGPINVYGQNITVSQNLNVTPANTPILVQARGRIEVDANETIKTNAGNIILRSNSEGTATSATAITLNSGSNLLSQGGNITLGGNFTGAQGAGLYATGTSGIVGVIVEGATLNAAGGNIKIYGKCNGSYNDGIRLRGNFTTSGSGTIELYGEAIGGNNGTYYYGGITFGNVASSTLETENGNIILSGLLTNTQSNSTGAINFYREGGAAGQTRHINLLSKNGNIEIIGNAGSTSAYGIGSSSWGNIYVGSPQNGTWTATGDVSFTFNRYLLANENGFKVKTTGDVAYLPTGANFTAALNFPYNTNNTLAENASSLTIGKLGNTSNITVASPVSLSAPIAIYGGTIAVNGTLSASSSTLSIEANTALTQTAAINANNLALTGTGTVTLNNTSNDVMTIAGGSLGNRLSSLSFTDAANGLTIGNIGSLNGIHANTGVVLVETLTGNINLNESISTNNTTSNAVIINAGKSASIGVSSGGNLLINGTPTITFGAGGIAKLFSGLETNSTGLTSFVSGAANVRYNFDETTTTFSPTLTSNTTHAIYRTSYGSGDLTIVNTGGDALNSTWVYENGVISTITTPVSINASIIANYLSTGDLTIEAANVTVSSAITSSSSNAFIINSNGIKTISLNAALSLGGAATFNCNDFSLGNGINISTSSSANITINAKNNFSTVSTIRRTISSAGGNITINADSDANGTGLLDLDYLTLNPGTGANILRSETVSWVTGSSAGPYINGTGSFTFESSDASFGLAVYTSWFEIDQDNNGISALTIGKSGSTQTTEQNSNLTVAGPVNYYGGFVNINGTLTSSGNSDILLKGINNSNASVFISAGGITKINGTGTLTMQGNGRTHNSGTISATGTGVLNVIMWSDFDGDNVGGGASNHGTISTNGGHVWIGGSNSSGGTYIWNGLSVGDGPSIGASGANSHALDIFGPITTSGGDLLLWAGNGFNGGTNGISTNAGWQLNVGSGDIVLITNVVLGVNGVPIFFRQTGGTFTLVPNGSSFPNPLNWYPLYGTYSTMAGWNFIGDFNYLWIDNPSALTNLTIGRYEGMTNGGTPVVMTNSSNITIALATSIAGSLNFYGSEIAMNANIATTNTTTGNISLNGTTLLGSGNIAIASNRIATLNFSSTSTYDGIISGTGSGLTKTGAGLLTLTKDNTYSGTTTISSGNLQIGTGGSVSQASSGTIANTSSVSVASGSKLMLSPNENLVFAAPISGAGGVEVKGASGNYYNSFLTGTAATMATNSTVLEVLTRITGGLQSGAAVANKTAGAYIKSYHAATNTATLQFQQFDGSYTKCVFVQLTQSGSNVQIRGNTSIFNGAAYRNGNHLGADMSTGSITAGLATSASAAGYGISQVYMSGKVNFTGSLTYTGNTVLSNTETNGTGTNVYSYTSKGTQEITDVSSSFPPTSTVVNNGLVIFNRSTAQTIQSNLEGTEDVLQVGATITLTGTCTHSGITTIDLNKSLIIGNSSTTGSITSNIINYGSLTFNRSDSSSYPGVISGTGSLIKSGGGTHKLTGLNNYSGTTTINDGTLVIEQDIPTTSSVSFSGIGKLVIHPSSNSFTSAVSYPIAGFNISSGIGGLTIGKPSNTANVTFTTTTTIAGPIAAYGGTIAINGALTATNANITLGATTAVTQTQAITANGISLSGAGNFTLNNTSNNASTISAGTNDAKIGNLSYTDASGGLTIGNINNPGVYSSGTVNIETLNGDITLTEPLLTTNATASAIKLYADKNKLIGDGTGGNVTLTGNGDITVGSGGTAMVYAGKYGLSSGLQKILNTSRVRYNVDATTSSFSPAIGAGIYGLFREGPFVWNGTASTNHTSGTNWQGNATPPEGSYIQVSPTATNSIVLDNNWNVGYIDLPTGKTIDLNGYNLTITGALNGSGKIKGSTTSSLTISGGVEFGTLYMDQTTNGSTNALQNFTIDRANQTVTIADTLVIAHNGTVTPTAGTIATGNKLKILSTINGTGRIAQLGSNADIIGDVTLQRHIEGSNIIMRGWRMMSIPTTNNAFNQLSDDILVSGPGGVSSGFDIAGPTSSIRLWQESATRGWASISNTNNTLTAGKGALIFFRGDRTQTSSLTNTSIVPNNVTSDYVGPINKGNVVVNLDFANDSTPIYGKGFNLMGNPYPSQIDWENISKTGLVDNYFWVWNPVTKGYVSNSTGIISSGQAFFVRATQTSQNVTFEENDKTATSATAYFKNSQELIVKMNLDSIQYDIAWLKFMGGASKNYVFKEDGLKLANTGYNLSFKTTNNVATQHNIVDFLALNQSDTFILSVNSSTNSAYTLSFDNVNQIPSNKLVLLRDLNNNSLTNLRSNNSYAFTINNNLINSYGNRFLLIITDSYNPLPVNITYFEGKRNLGMNHLTWNAAQEKNIAYYQVQRSNDGEIFTNIGVVKANNSSTKQVYLFKDENAADLDVAYYRLKITEQNGDYKYSNTVVLSDDKRIETNINVYPIPTKDWLNIETKKDILDLKIFDARGVLVKETKVLNKVNLSNLQPGVYLLKLNTIDGLSTHKIIKE